MCGLCGFVGPPAGESDLEAARGMRDLLAHRGPDGAGELAIRAAGEPPMEGWLGHRRLKVLDLTESSDQPMTNEDGSVALLYNGEVYNFRELRAELESLGWRFRSTGDTEVVLRAYEAWGFDFVARIDGMFALALWDARQGNLILARDRVGKKPLYYTTQGGRLTFGSEIKALLAAPWVEARPDFERLGEFLTFGYVPFPDTLLPGIKQVPPASVIVYGRNGLESPREYWDALPERQDLVPDRNAGQTIAELLENAVRRRLVADVPVGALLSGGMDSSLVVGLMARAGIDRVRTFSIGFPDEPSFDERGYARLVAERFRTDHTEFAVKADAVALLETLLWHHDQPFADSSAIPTYLVCELAREQVTVVLNGDGGDEVFGGYDRFAAVKLAQAVPRPLSRLASAATRVVPRQHGYYSLRRRAERFLEGAAHSPRDRYQSWIAVLNDDLIGSVMAFSPNGDDGPGVGAAVAMDEWYGRAADLPVLDQVMYANFKSYLPDDLAVKMDRMSMAHSLETRSPFLDTALCEYLARMPAHHKVGLRQVKPLLRLALEPLLPKEIWNRKKHGFGVPLGHWFRHELKVMFEDEVLASGARTRTVLHHPAIADLWDEHQRGDREHGFRFWTILTLEHWLRSLERPLEGPPRRPVISG